MKFTPSQDGRDRATVRVAFRVGYDRLHASAADLIYASLVDQGLNAGDAAARQSAREARALTRAAIEEEVRDALKRNGYSDDGRGDDSLWSIAYESAGPVAARYWPELADQWDRLRRRPLLARVAP